MSFDDVKVALKRAGFRISIEDDLFEEYTEAVAFINRCANFKSNEE